MMTPAASPPTTDLKDTLEEIRASVAARGSRHGLAGAFQEMILAFVNLLMALLADLRAGKLAPIAPVAGNADAGVAGAKTVVRVRPTGCPATDSVADASDPADAAAGAERWRGAPRFPALQVARPRRYDLVTTSANCRS